MSPSLVMIALPFSLIGIDLVANAFLPAAQAQKGGSGAEVIAALRAYTGAISQKDIEACLAAYAPGPDSVMLGTGPGERWQGPDEIRDAHLHFFSGFDEESGQSTWNLIQVSGDVAWVASMSQITNYFKNEKNEFAMNISAVLVKQDGQWRISLFHFSNVTGPEAEGPA